VFLGATTGDADGLVLTLDAPAAAELRFQSEPVSFSLRLGTLGSTPNVVLAGKVECEVSVEYVDQGARPGVNAYWVRVLQEDDERAWSSPIYVEMT